jgi:integrase
MDTALTSTHSFAATSYDHELLHQQLAGMIVTLRFPPEGKRRMKRECAYLCNVLDEGSGGTLQERWCWFERMIWPTWVAGENRSSPNHWTWGVRAMVTGRLIRPSWQLLTQVRISQWLDPLPADDPVLRQRDHLAQTLATISWSSTASQTEALNTGLRLLLTCGYGTLQQITEGDFGTLPPGTQGLDLLDAAFCTMGIFSRTPKRGTSRRRRLGRHSPAELVARSDIPERFRPVTTLYLEAYTTRISDVYATTRHKVRALGHFWQFLDQQYPEVQGSADIIPLHARAFVPHAIERARRVRRGRATDPDDRATAHAWLTDVRTFFADLCTWGTEPDSPFTPYVPRTIPLSRHDLLGLGFDLARKRTAARMAATVFDLEREISNIRMFAFQQWSQAEEACGATPTDRRIQNAETVAFWDWAILELLIQSGLRIEEASELTTLDVLKRQMPDGRIYYLLHVKPSKYDRARVIPIGDGLGRVIAEIIRHVKRFYGTDSVPFCDHWDHNEKRPRPSAPYLLQGAKHPSAIGISTIRGRLRALSIAAGARKADGSPLVLLPHDCRRLFASEHLNNDVPVHVIQALLGHASIDTVMVYAKLYPAHFVDEYRKAVRGAYGAIHGEGSLRNPTAEEWAAFAASCSMRDMGTHLCALPAGEHCSKGLVCLGCVHAQPKKSAAPVFHRMLASHERELCRARERKEPAGQIAAREMEVGRIRAALRRAEELALDVASAIEEVGDPSMAHATQ